MPWATASNASLSLRVAFHVADIAHAPLAQLAEATGLEPVRWGFESLGGYRGWRWPCRGGFLYDP